MTQESENTKILIVMKSALQKNEILFLFFIYAIGVFLRLFPRLSLDPHLITFEADIWYRLCLVQYFLDQGHLPVWDIRYEAYGQVPLWYNPFSIWGFAALSKIFSLDLPTLCSRVLPWIESLSILPIYFLCREIYNRRVAVLATIFLSLSPSFIFWTGIADPQSFTLVLIPLMILFWIRFVAGRYFLQNRWWHLLFMGILLALNFLIHLTFFNLVIILILVQLALVLENQSKARNFLYLLVPVAFSQLLSAWWWLPHNLYWWWTQVLTTSSAYWEGLTFLKNYGMASGIFGHLAFLALIIFILRHHKSFPPFYLIPIAWALFPMLECHNEGLLKLIDHTEWTWANIAKPLEGFRFYVFLSQPLAVCFGLIVDRWIDYFPFKKKNGELIFFLTGLLCVTTLTIDMFRNYNLFGRFGNPSMTIEEIRAAEWFRNHSGPKDRILAEYFTAQMFCGINGGKCLEGSMFPLKNVDIPYITDGWQVQKDIYSVYTSEDPQWVGEVLKRYGCTHVFLSQKSLGHIEFLTQGDEVLEDVTGLLQKNFSATLFNPRYFQTLYRDKDIRILKWIGG